MTDMTCPVCGCEQGAGLLCSRETDNLERELGDVRWLVDELAVTLSRQAKISTPGKSGKGWAHEKLPIHEGARQAGDVLANTLTTWARDVSGDPQSLGTPGRPPAVQAAWILLASIDEIRRHPEVGELVDEITDAIGQARRVVDRPADRVYVGPCRAVSADEYGVDTECGADLFAAPGAAECRCRVCSADTVVAEQREWLLGQAADQLFTVPAAARLIGANGSKSVTQEWIWRQIHGRHKRLAYRPGTKLIRLGDLMAILTDDRVKESAA